jgi:hypothetical protein
VTSWSWNGVLFFVLVCSPGRHKKKNPMMAISRTANTAWEVLRALKRNSAIAFRPLIGYGLTLWEGGSSFW